jgi:hypothetical protein
MKVDRNPAWIFNLKITHCLRLEITIALGKKRGAGPSSTNIQMATCRERAQKITLNAPWKMR